jgi:putative ABC transport system permease protein
MNISILSIILGLLLLALPAYLLARLDMPLLVRAAKATVRMMIQMAVVGALLWALWQAETLWVSLLWVALTIVAAAWLLVKRTRLQQKLLFMPVCGGLLAGVLVVGAYLLLVLRLEQPFSTRWIVPVGGVLLAHVLTTNTRAVSAYFEALKTDTLSYYTQLGNGASRLVALTPYVRQALRSMMEPTVSSLAVMGLFALPMLLVGLLLGGVTPVQATILFVLLVVAGITASVLALMVTLWLADKKAFNKRGELKDVFMS